jgi:hypothetical protein
LNQAFNSQVESVEVRAAPVVQTPRHVISLKIKKTKKRIRKRSDKTSENRLLIRIKNDSLFVEPGDAANFMGLEKPERTERFHSNLRSAEFETQESLNEGNKINVKIQRIKSYWTLTSQLIPNTFRITCYLDDDPKHLLEYQDLSKKEVLAQYHGKQSNSFEFVDMSESRDNKRGCSREQNSFRKNKSGSKSVIK